MSEERETDLEAALVRAATRGDGRAFGALYARHHRATLAQLTKIVGRGPDQEDLLQEVFLQLHRALPSFERKAKLSTFLYRITRNVAIDYLRRRSRQQPLGQGAERLARVEGGGPDPERCYSAREQLRTLLLELENLSARKRQALLLVAFSGRSLSQAARMLGTSPAAVKQRVGSARRELAGHLTREP